MFTYNRVVKDVKNEPARRREVTVEFRNEQGHTKEAMLSFSIGESVDVIKKAFQAYIDDINAEPSAITDLTLTPDVPTQLTQAELDKQAWDSNWNKLQMVDKLIAAQILTGVEAPVVALRNKVKADFKVTYLA